MKMHSDNKTNLDEERLEEVTHQNFLMTIFKSPKIVCSLASTFMVSLLFFNLYINYSMFNPKDRMLSNENVYSGNELVISEDEVSNMISKINGELGTDIKLEDEDDYCLFNAILENDNLDETRKEVFARAIQVIKDNPYANKEACYKALLNAEVLYKGRPFFSDRRTEGVFDYDHCSIGVFVDDPEFRVLFHEIIHCIFTTDNSVNLPTYFKEGVTELLANEYFSDNPFIENKNYPFEVAVVKMLCEVSSPEAVLEAYSTGDMSAISKSIANVTLNEEEVDKSLVMLDRMMRQYNGELKKDEEKLSKEELISGFIPLFRKVIETRYEVDDPARISYFYNEILIANIFDEKPYDSYVDDILEFGSYQRAYFSTELKATLKKDGQMIKVKSTTN